MKLALTPADLGRPRGRLFFTVDQVLELGIMPLSRSTIYEAIQLGDIGSVRMKGRILVPLAELLRLAGFEPLPLQLETVA